MRVTKIAARSMSKHVSGWLDRGPSSAHVFAAFDRVCNLATSGGDVIALAAPQVGDGPLNVVLGGKAALWGQVRPGSEVMCEADRLTILSGAGHRSFTIDLRRAALWEPCPDWDSLRARRGTMLPGLEALRTLCLSEGSNSVLLTLLGQVSRDSAAYVRPSIILELANEASICLRAGWGGEAQVSLQRGAAAIAGLGGGLTPAGDDFLVGLMLWAWLAHPVPGPFCQALVEEAAPRTTFLSAAFLRAAARGQCSAAWQRLLLALAGGREGDVVLAGRQVLGFGASSGADALVGFLYLAPGTCL
jgi:hypothetical protein